MLNRNFIIKTLILSIGLQANVLFAPAFEIKPTALPANTSVIIAGTQSKTKEEFIERIIALRNSLSWAGLQVLADNVQTESRERADVETALSINENIKEILADGTLHDVYLNAMSVKKSILEKCELKIQQPTSQQFATEPSRRIVGFGLYNTSRRNNTEKILDAAFESGTIINDQGTSSILDPEAKETIFLGLMLLKSAEELNKLQQALNKAISPLEITTLLKAINFAKQALAEIFARGLGCAELLVVSKLEDNTENTGALATKKSKLANESAIAKLLINPAKFDGNRLCEITVEKGLSIETANYTAVPKTNGDTKITLNPKVESDQYKKSLAIKIPKNIISLEDMVKINPVMLVLITLYRALYGLEASFAETLKDSNQALETLFKNVALTNPSTSAGMLEIKSAIHMLQHTQCAYNNDLKSINAALHKFFGLEFSQLEKARKPKATEYPVFKKGINTLSTLASTAIIALPAAYGYAKSCITQHAIESAGETIVQNLAKIGCSIGKEGDAVFCSKAFVNAIANESNMEARMVLVAVSVISIYYFCAKGSEMIDPGKKLVELGQTLDAKLRPWFNSCCQWTKWTISRGVPVAAALYLVPSLVKTAFGHGSLLCAIDTPLILSIIFRKEIGKQIGKLTPPKFAKTVYFKLKGKVERGACDLTKKNQALPIPQIIKDGALRAYSACPSLTSIMSSKDQVVPCSDIVTPK